MCDSDSGGQCGVILTDTGDVRDCPEGIDFVGPDVNGGWLRKQRHSRGWDVPEMARRLASAAGATRSDLPDHECLVRYVRRWEGGGGVSERYRLLYAKAFGLPGDLRASSGAAPDVGARRPYEPEVVAAIGAALHASSGGAGKARDLEAVQRDVVQAWRLRQSDRYAELGGLLGELLRETAAHLGAAVASADAPAALSAAVHLHNTVSSLLKRLEAFEMAAIAADRAFCGYVAAGEFVFGRGA
jgi:hypothetical protein